MPAQISLPVGDRHFGQHLVNGLKKLRMRYVDITGRRRARATAVVFPGEVWRQLLQLHRVHHVILRSNVPQFDRGTRILREPRLHREDGLGVFGRLPGRIADQLEHVGHVLNKIFA